MADRTPLEEQLLQAQYTGLRGEIVARTNSIFQIFQLTLVAFGVILTVSYSQNGDNDLVLLYPFVGLFAAILYLSNRVAVGSIAKYLREEVEQKFTLPQNMQWWETWLAHNLVNIGCYGVLLELAILCLFVGTQVLALIAYYFVRSSRTDSVTLNPLGGELATAATILTFLLVAILDLWVVWGELRKQFPSRSKQSTTTDVK